MKTQNFKSQYGRKGISVSVECPTRSIRHHLGSVHVGTPNSKIDAMIRDQVTIQRESGNDDWTGRREEEAVRFALWEHEENGAQYQHVMGGGHGSS